jgi:hypothetical protein
MAGEPDSREEVLKDEILSSSLKGASPVNEHSFVVALEGAKDDEIANLGRRDILAMRKQWSFVLLLLIAAIVIYDMWFTTALGKGWIQFIDNKLVVYFILENLAKIGGLAYIVVNFLFDRNRRFK